MKFTMFEKETKDEKYANNLLKLTNFKQDENGTLICPNSKKFNFKYTRNVKGNKYDRTEKSMNVKTVQDILIKKNVLQNLEKMEQ